MSDFYFPIFCVVTQLSIDIRTHWAPRSSSVWSESLIGMLVIAIGQMLFYVGTRRGIAEFPLLLAIVITRTWIGCLNKVNFLVVRKICYNMLFFFFLNESQIHKKNLYHLTCLEDHLNEAVILKWAVLYVPLKHISEN